MERKSVDTDLMKSIEIIRNGVKNDVDFHNKAIKICLEFLTNLKQVVIDNGFASEQEEINFFKTTKQSVLHRLLYYSKLNSFELQFPKGNKEIKKKYTEAKLKKLNDFFRTHLEFVQYIEQGLTHLDKYYFTRQFAADFQPLLSVSCYRDPEFSTSHDLLLATLKANKKMVVYLEEKLKRINHPELVAPLKTNLKWTSTKSALTELTYALYHGGAVNNGNTDIIEIAQALQRTFNFPIGDVYRTFTEIRSRKKGRTKFLDELSTSLLMGMDRLEE